MCLFYKKKTVSKKKPWGALDFCQWRTDSMAECDICGQYFGNPFELGPHKKACWNNQADVLSDFTQCDSDEDRCIIQPLSEDDGVPLITQPASPPSLSWLATRRIDTTCRVNDIHVTQTQQLQPDLVYNFVPVVNQYARACYVILFSHTYVCARADAKKVGTVRDRCVPFV